MIKELFKKLNIEAGLLHFVCNDRMVAFCHASIPQAFRTSYKKVAFTLAEVLITLAIIGIVAALTIPVLNQKMKNVVVETRLKKAYAEMTQAIRLSENENGDASSWNANSVEEYWNRYFKPYLKYDSANVVYKNSNSSLVDEIIRVELKNGSVFDFNLWQGEEFGSGTGGQFFFYSSKKCLKKGGALGECVFMFGFWPGSNPNSERFKYHSKQGVIPYLANWNGNTSLYADNVYGCNTNANRFYCTEVIKRNNWKIPKDYPFKVWY